MEKFSYYNKNNLLKWIGLIISFVLLFFLIFFVVMLFKKGERPYIMIIPLIGILFVFINIVNKMFFAKIYVNDKQIEYKSPFTHIVIKKDKMKGVDLIKNPRNRGIRYLPMEKRPEINVGRYYLIIRKTFEKPDDFFLLALSPVTENHITIEYRDDIYNALVKFGYIKPE